MKYIVGRDNIKLNNTVVTLGKFDGIHLGHKLLIDESIRSKEYGLTSVLFTFGQNNEDKYIYNEEEKRKLIEDTGIDVCIVYPFDNITRNMSANDFVEKILVGDLGIKKVVVGKDFRFGKGRCGDVELLKSLSEQYGYEVTVFEKKMSGDGKKISSRRIRDNIANSNLDIVNRELGRAYSFSGIVSKGRQLGRTIGFPTINIIPDEGKVLPKNGVYASRIVFENEPDVHYVGMTNVGNNPTVANGLRKVIETNIFDFNKVVYGQKVQVYITKFVREERKFGSLDDLKQQISKDKELLEFF